MAVWQGDERASPEVRLLVLSARSLLSPAQAARASEIVRTDLDWTRLLSLAERHGVLPLLSRSLAVLAGDLVPRSVLRRLRASCTGIALRNQALTTELMAILDALEFSGIRAIPYKGPVLAEAVYGDLSLRPFGDLDVLVCRRDSEAAVNVLCARGFELIPPFHSERQVAFVRKLSGPDLTRYMHSRSEHHFLRARGQVLVDLHLRVADPFIRFGLDADALLGRTEIIVCAGSSVRSLSPEDLLLILCLNGAKDAWTRLLRVCDISELLRARSDLDWDLVRSRARQLGVLRLLRISLDLAAQLLETPPPASFLVGLPPDPVADQLSAQVRQRLFTPAPKHVQGVTLGYCRFMASIRERRSDRAWLFLHLALTPGVADWMLVRLPAHVQLLYYFIRPMRLAWTYGRRALKRLYPDSASPGDHRS